MMNIYKWNFFLFSFLQVEYVTLRGVLKVRGLEKGGKFTFTKLYRRLNLLMKVYTSRWRSLMAEKERVNKIGV